MLVVVTVHMWEDDKLSFVEIGASLSCLSCPKALSTCPIELLIHLCE